MANARSDPRSRGPNERPVGASVLIPLGRAWIIAGVIAFCLAAAVAYEPSFDGPAAVAVTILPGLLAVAMVVAFLAPLRGWSWRMQLGATSLTIIGWSLLMFDDTNWSILSFALYALCFAAGRGRGIASATAVSLIWALAILSVDGAGWALLAPISALAVGAVISITLWGAAEQNTMLTALVDELRLAQEDLADAEREKGVLEERARFAGEIHDTLAQGFTSIVLLSRAAMRGEQPSDDMSADERWRDIMTSIEETAEENLQAARRLVAAIGPAELDHASLPDALERQVSTTLQTDIEADFRVVGAPRSLNGTLNVTVLRAAQEALLNVRSHSRASKVHATLTYLDDVVVLDIRDNGVGFTPGTTSDRGALTGGQGLKTLAHRAASLGGQLTVEAKEGGGAALSLHLPAPRS